MDTKLARKWAKALRSGKFKQGKSELRSNAPDGSSSYCCLGVLCEINGESDEVMEHTGLSTAGVLDKYGMSGPMESALMELNDDANYTFEEIAEVIDAITTEGMCDDKFDYCSEITFP